MKPLFVIPLIAAAAAQGATITMTFSGYHGFYADGVWAGEHNFTFTAIADTDDVEVDGLFLYLDHASATIEIEGVGTFDVTTPTRTFYHTTNGFVGLANDQDYSILMGPFGFFGWDMISSAAPHSGSTSYWSQPFSTSSGVTYEFGTYAGGPVTFSATVASLAVPMPAAAPLAAVGLAALAARRRR